MKNEIIDKRGLFFVLVIMTVVIFVGLVWVIATYFPWKLLDNPGTGNAGGTERTTRNCTYPISYWKEHPELYPAQMVIGGEVSEAKDIAAILSDESDDLAVHIKAQLAGVFLNMVAGAEQNSIETAIFEAYGWLEQHPDGSGVSEEDSKTGTRLFNVLEAYNLGMTAVGACENITTTKMTETISPTYTPTTKASMTPSQTVTPTASNTATPTSTSTATLSISVPSRTPSPTTSEPGRPPATRTPMPSATQAPTNTTQPPTATNTSPPPATPTFTQPPLPTSTYTPPPLPTP